MAQNAPENYVPLYATQDEWQDKELQQFAIDFYRISDNPEENQRWVDSFTEDASVQIGADKARGSKDLAEFRSRMWKHIKERRHTVLKVFPGRFSDSNECMILGEVSVTTTDGRLKEALGRHMQSSGRLMDSGSLANTASGCRLMDICCESHALQR
ncbi:uncharacterized protein BKA55DRAFT_684748 [Fusarium redolens]|uniref:SnoaL-like domain-containing protein n=1 Tax=Fusarium redolens TaxID=48865 RepID=A0A9P9KS00_FUSRE|nr:uncharacterized protein BKA55DRAFT_684748 [Fusarium redolens]KAH7267480.1 hypothetical protein BKA55DRAFT_684748 [Fusarium redolens]